MLINLLTLHAPSCTCIIKVEMQLERISHCHFFLFLFIFRVAHFSVRGIIKMAPMYFIASLWISTAKIKSGVILDSLYSNSSTKRKAVSQGSFYCFNCTSFPSCANKFWQDTEQRHLWSLQLNKLPFSILISASEHSAIYK